MEKEQAIIIGAGPAGLTAAFEFATRTDVKPVVLEASDEMGGISRTIRHNGNRIDIGGHRFFSKSDRVMRWWLDMLPLQRTSGNHSIAYRNKVRSIEGAPAGPDPETTDKVMLLRHRKSRIYFSRRFFDYPISLSMDTIGKLGVTKMSRIGLSYARAIAFPIRDEQNLEQFFINRFGRELYLTFFKSYTEKVWGVPCCDISAAWGAQRIKGLSIAKAVANFFRREARSTGDLAQKGVETSLIEQFMYPKFGPGQMWEETARQVKLRGGEVLTGWYVNQIETDGNRINAVKAQHRETGEQRTFGGQYFFSTMPVRELVAALDRPAPQEVRETSEGLAYRDFITVGLLVSDLKIRNTDGSRVEDNWIYIQEPDVRVGRLQIFNNWSPYMVADPNTVWLGLEYFCYEADDLWKMADDELIELATAELHKIGIIDAASALDATVIRVRKAYPAYFGTYDKFGSIRDYLNTYENLFLVGRNGMHKYNNQDHSMLTAMMAVDNIIEGRVDKSNIWEVNTEEDYHESADEKRRLAS